MRAWKGIKELPPDRCELILRDRRLSRRAVPRHQARSTRMVGRLLSARHRAVSELAPRLSVAARKGVAGAFRDAPT